MQVQVQYEDAPAVVDDRYQAWVEMGDWDEYDHLYEYVEV